MPKWVDGNYGFRYLVSKHLGKNLASVHWKSGAYSAMVAVPLERLRSGFATVEEAQRWAVEQILADADVIIQEVRCLKQ